MYRDKVLAIGIEDHLKTRHCERLFYSRQSAKETEKNLVEKSKRKVNSVNRVQSRDRAFCEFSVELRRLRVFPIPYFLKKKTNLKMICV